MKRRTFLSALVGVAGVSTLPNLVSAQHSSPTAPGGDKVKIALQQANGPMQKIEKLELSKDEWKKRLTPAQYNVLRDEGTERPDSSPLGAEKRKGVFHCAGCAGLQL